MSYKHDKFLNQFSANELSGATNIYSGSVNLNEIFAPIDSVGENITASNGLTKEGSVIVFGGSLTGDTVLSGSANNFSLGNSSSKIGLYEQLSSKGSFTYNISDGSSVDTNFTDIHHVNNDNSGTLHIASRRLSGSNNSTENVSISAGGKDSGNYFGYYDYQASKGNIDIEAFGESGVDEFNHRARLRFNGDGFYLNNSTWNGSSYVDNSYLNVTRNGGLVVDDTNSGLGLNYNDRSVDESNINWFSDANHIPSAGMVKENTLPVSSNVSEAVIDNSFNFTELHNNSERWIFAIDSDSLTTFTAQSKFYYSSEGFSLYNSEGDGAGVELNKVGIAYSPAYFSNDLEIYNEKTNKGIKYESSNSYSSITWSTDNDHIPSVGMVKNHFLPLDYSESWIETPLSGRVSTIFTGPSSRYYLSTQDSDFANITNTSIIDLDNESLNFTYVNVDRTGSPLYKYVDLNIGVNGVSFRNEYGTAIKYKSSSDYSGVTWSTDNDHIPSIGMIKENISGSTSSGSSIHVSTFPEWVEAMQDNDITAIYVDDEFTISGTMDLSTTASEKHIFGADVTFGDGSDVTIDNRVPTYFHNHTVFPVSSFSGLSNDASTVEWYFTRCKPAVLEGGAFTVTWVLIDYLL